MTAKLTTLTYKIAIQLHLVTAIPFAVLAPGGQSGNFWIILIQFTPTHLISLRYILILSWLRLGLPDGLFASGFHTKILYTLLFPYACYIPRRSHLLWFNYPTVCGEAYMLWSPSLCSPLQPPANSSLL